MRDAHEIITFQRNHERGIRENQKVVSRAGELSGMFQGASGVGSIVRHALQRAVIHAPTYGAHQFRHGLATEMFPWVYYCLFGLLSVSGLRLGEARNLELQDVDLEAGVLTVLNAKFGKTRLVPLHASTCKVLTEYLARRQDHWAGRPVSPYLFVSSRGNRLDSGQIHRAFYLLSRQIGLRGASDRHGPQHYEDGWASRLDAVDLQFD